MIVWMCVILYLANLAVSWLLIITFYVWKRERQKMQRKKRFSYTLKLSSRAWDQSKTTGTVLLIFLMNVASVMLINAHGLKRVPIHTRKAGGASGLSQEIVWTSSARDCVFEEWLWDNQSPVWLLYHFLKSSCRCKEAETGKYNTRFCTLALPNWRCPCDTAPYLAQTHTTLWKEKDAEDEDASKQACPLLGLSTARPALSPAGFSTATTWPSGFRAKCSQLLLPWTRLHADTTHPHRAICRFWALFRQLDLIIILIIHCIF